MNRSLLALAGSVLFAGLLAVSCTNNKGDGPGDESGFTTRKDTIYKRYGVKQAWIHYEASGYRRGTEDLYFTDWGRTEARYSNTENLTERGIQPMKNVTISKGADIKVADLINNRGFKRHERFVDSLLSLDKLPDPNSIAEEFLQKMHYTKQGQDTVLGLMTNVWFEPSTGTTLNLWRGVVLRQKVENPQQHHLVQAVSIDTVNPIDASKFTPPTGIEYGDPPPMPGR